MKMVGVCLYMGVAVAKELRVIMPEIEVAVPFFLNFQTMEKPWFLS